MKKPNITGGGDKTENASEKSTSVNTVRVASEDFSLSKTFAVVNQMVEDGVIQTYALGGAMGLHVSRRTGHDLRYGYVLHSSRSDGGQCYCPS